MTTVAIGTPAEPVEEPRMLSVREAGQRLGRGERYARRLIAERRVTYIKLGKARSSPVLIPETEIERLKAEGTVERVE